MRMNVTTKILCRDMGFFIIVYSIGVSATFIGSERVKSLVALFLIAFYILYVVLTVKNDNANHGELEPLYIVKLFNVKPSLAVILFQIILALSGIIFGANIFVMNLELISCYIGIPALVLSLIITPIATELPEKFNSVIWIRKRKDTLALGNISGAMVFQSCIPVSIGILFTSWHLEDVALISAILAILSSTVVYCWMKIRGKLTPVPLLTGGVLYIVYILYLFLLKLK
jgi:cation:H+ antiporter